MTKHRTEMLSELKKCSEALSATELHVRLPHINQVTIYRNLEQFVNEGLVKELFLTNQEALYEIQDEPHHHAVCTTCNSVIHFTFNDKSLVKEFALPNFKINHVSVTIHGECSEHKLQKQPRTKTKQK